MKSHAIIPIFIPHEGCPNACVFCSQHKITSRENPVSASELPVIFERYLATLRGRGLSVIEAAFYGGSFTGLPIERQSEYLEAAFYYKRRGEINKIRLSTRPDYIDETILSNLARYGADTIELGVQSFDEEVLAKSKRGHGATVIYESCGKIKNCGFELGIQLMAGLPGATHEKDVYSASELARIKPHVARIYPTVVIEGTELHKMYLAGRYVPLTLAESVNTTKEMYRIITQAGVNVIRIGLKAPPRAVAAGDAFHPSFRQLVESELARDILEGQLCGILEGRPSAVPPRQTTALFCCNKKSFSNMTGHNKSNRIYFREKYPYLDISYKISDNIADNEYKLIL